MFRQTVAIVDLDAIRSNCALARQLAANSRIIAVIKADAYGHGAIKVARAVQQDVEAFAVAIIEEAVELRDAGVEKPILVLEGASDKAAVEAASAYRLWLMMNSKQQVDTLMSANTDSPLTIWLKIDTGMHRLGIEPRDLAMILQRFRSVRNITRETVLCTHLSSADDRSSELTRTQVDRFKTCVAEYDMPWSISNSAGILAWPETHATWNRPGYMLYGNSPFADPWPNADQLKPAMTLSAELIAIRHLDPGDSVGYGATWTAARPSVIGTVAIGYADGYPGTAKNGTPTLVNGQTAPLVGAVSMDMISIDLTGHSNVRPGDSVILWGDGLSVSEVAANSGTLGYELLTRISSRVPRRYLESAACSDANQGSN